MNNERDRLILIGGVVLAVLVCTWMFVVSPERNSASAVQAQVAQAQQTVSSAQSALSTAQSSRARYASSYSALVNVGKAVPATPEVPSLIYELDAASHVRNVQFAAISAGAAGGGSSSTAATPAPTGFTALPFTLGFNGSFFDLYHLLGRLNTFAVQTKSGALIVTGRLLTIQGVTLTGSSSATGPTGQLTGTVNVDAYVMPPASASGSTAAGTPTATPAAGATPSSTGTPAVIQPNP